METASSPHDFKLMLAAGGQRASGIEQVLESNGDADAAPRAARRAVPQGFACDWPNH